MVEQRETTEDLLMKATTLASTFASWHDKKNEVDDSVVSPLSIYNAGLLLYETKLTHKTHYYDALSQAFQQLLQNLNNDYLENVIFHELNTALNMMLESSIKSTSRIKNSSNSSDDQALLRSVSAMCGIYDALLLDSTHQERVEKLPNHQSLLRFAFNVDVCKKLVIYYDSLIEDETSKNGLDETSKTKQTCILSLMSSLLLHGLILNSSSQRINIGQLPCTFSTEDEAIEYVMGVIQTITDQSEISYCLGDTIAWQEKQLGQHQHKSILDAATNLFSMEVSTQKEYLISVLQAAPKSSQRDELKAKSKNSNTASNSAHSNTITTKRDSNHSKVSAMERNIQQVHTIFPHIGEGFIEAALACYNHNIEETSNALMEGEINPASLHPRLRVLDKSLPARRKETKETYSTFGRPNNNNTNGELDKEDEEARAIQKARIQELIAAQEDEAYKLGVAMATNDAEYNDDYDDQYDGMGDDIGGADSGLYDTDFDSIRAYNKVAKEMESDRVFWEENQNTNRSNKSISKSRGKGEGNDSVEDIDDDDKNNDQVGQKKFRGPDKGKGGRAIGPDGRYLPHPKSRKKGGKVVSQNNATNDETSKDKKSTDEKNNDQLSKIQKRRKNDNKSKIGNHHRKERSLKKTGM
jgi:hypothetical protein